MELELNMLLGGCSGLKTVMFYRAGFLKACCKEELDSSSYELNSLPVKFVEQPLSAIVNIILAHILKKP